MKLSNDLLADDYQLKDLAAATDDQDAPTYLQLRRRSIQLPFAYGDATPASVDPKVPAGCMVVKVGLHLDVPFNGVGAALTVGDAGDTDRLMLATQNDPTTAASYETHPTYRYVAETTITLSITPGTGGTQGRGVLTITIEVPDF